MKLKNAFRRMSTAAAVLTLCVVAAGNLKAQNTFLVSATELNFSYQLGAAGPALKTISVLPANGQNGPYTAALSTNGGGNWLGGGQREGNTPGTIDVTVFTGVIQQVGQYTGQVVISATGFTTRTIPVKLSVTATSDISFSPNTSLAFTASVGSPPQMKSLVVSSSGSPLTYTATASTQPAANWLKISQINGTTESSTGTITVTVDPTGLAVGNYSGSISAQAPGATYPPGLIAISIPVTLNVVATPQFTSLPTALSFNFQTGGSIPLPQNLKIDSSSGSLPFSVTTESSGWLKVNPLGGSTPATLTVTADPTGLALVPNTYLGKITVNSSLVVEVKLVVSNFPLLNVQPSTLQFTTQVGQPSVQGQTLNVTTTSGTIPYTITTFSSGWLFALPIPSSTDIQVSVQPGSLPAGTYEGRITVAPTDGITPSQVVSVRLIVSAAVSLTLSMNTLNFSAQGGGTQPPPQSFSITASDNVTPVPFQITTSTQQIPTWLTTLTTSATGNVTPAQVSVMIDPSGLSAGNYVGTVTVVASGIANASTMLLTVNLTVTQQAYAALPARLTFTQVAGATAPGPQSVAISTAIAGGATYQASASVTPGNWLSVTPTTTQFTPSSIQVNANGSTLLPGIYQGTVTINGTAGQTIIPVTLTVTMAPPLNLAPAALTFNYQLGGAVPLPQNIAVTAGSPMNFTAAASSSGNWLAVTQSTSATPSQLTATVSPTGLTAGTYTGTITATPAGGAGSAAVAQVTLFVTAPATPVVTGFVNAASFAPGPAVPGMIVTLFGTAMGPVNVVSANVVGGFFETKVSDTRVLFDGVAAPLIYTSATQVAAIVPYTLYGRLSTMVQVEYLGVRSTSLILRVDNSLPGLFAANASGRGGGAILNQDNSLNTSTNPATKGQAIVLYATGEGQTTPVGIDGKIIGVDLRKSLLPVSVKVGGVDCTVEYAGSAPSLVSGVFQVNVRLNSSVPSGLAVPVVLQVGSVSSQDGLTVAIR